MAIAERPISAVLHDIVGNVQHIVRSEFRLAKTEISEELGKSGGAAILIGAGAAMLLLSGVFVLLAIVYALSAVMPSWAAALIVGVGEGVMAAVCIVLGIRKFKTVRGVPKTAEVMKENVEWAKQLSK